MVEELKFLLNEISKLTPEQKSVYQTWVVVSLIRDLAYYTVIGVVAIALGRRIIHAILTAYREAGRRA
jgi:hypothetical protein